MSQEQSAAWNEISLKAAFLLPAHGLQEDKRLSHGLDKITAVYGRHLFIVIYSHLVFVVPWGVEV